MTNEHGVRIIPASEDLARAQAMLERERNSGPYSGKARMLASLEARIAVLRKREERERK